MGSTTEMAEAAYNAIMAMISGSTSFKVFPPAKPAQISIKAGYNAKQGVLAPSV